MFFDGTNKQYCSLQTTFIGIYVVCKEQIMTKIVFCNKQFQIILFPEPG